MRELVEEPRVRRRAGLLRARATEHPRERVAYGGIFAVALVLRLLELGEKPLHHDETAHAWITWRLFTGEGYEYDPAFHGPLQFFLYASAFFLVGVGDTAMRVLPALFGSALTVLPWFLRGQLGRVAALAASALFAISPSYLYFSRFAREDIYIATLTLLLIVLVFRFLAAPRPWHPAAILGVLAASFATKESTYITAFVGGTFLLAAFAADILRQRRSGLPARTSRLLAALRAPGFDGWMWGATAFALVFTLLFSTFLFHPQGLRDGLYDSLAYWLSQHEVERGSQPWFYYLFLIPAYELPIVVPGLVGVVVALRRPTLLRVFLVYDLVLSLAVYSWAGERMPWLIVHPLLPLVLLAGIGAQATWEATRRRRRPLALAGAAVGAAVLVHGATAVTYHHPADPAEPLVFTQNSVDVHPVRDTLLQLDRRSLTDGGEHARILVDSHLGGTWPWAWYLRDIPASYVDMTRAVQVDDADAVLVEHTNEPRLRPLLRGFDGYRFKLREWWVIDFGAMTPRALGNWFLHREPWNERGSLDQWLYVRDRSTARRPPTGARSD